jgi:hypothetical protein
MAVGNVQKVDNWTWTLWNSAVQPLSFRVQVLCSAQPTQSFLTNQMVQKPISSRVVTKS